jgi:branched-subunit amino acid ABC-type transport system permease component
MTYLLQQIASGLAMGGIYACLGLALVMIYRSTHHINFAQGEMAMFSTFVASMLLKAGMPYGVVFFLTLAFGFVMGMAIERVVLRPLKDAPEVSIIVVFIGLYLGINSLAGWLFGHQLQGFPSPLLLWSIRRRPPPGCLRTRSASCAWPFARWDCCMFSCGGRGWGWPCGLLPSTPWRAVSPASRCR